MREFISLGIIIAIVSLATRTATGITPPAETPTAVVVFGDSSVDTGWYKTTPSGFTVFDNYLQNPSYRVGKPTNNPGPMSVEVLAALLHTTANTANQGGTNYATSGAKNVATNPPTGDGFPNAIPTVTQINNYIQGPRPAARNELFVIDSGANDIGFAVKNRVGFEQIQYIQFQVGGLAAAIAKLQQGGAQRIIVVNQAESFGTDDVRYVRKRYNTMLQNDLANLGVIYTWGDLNHVREAIVTNPAHFNIVYTGNGPAVTACPPPSMPPANQITTAWALVCSIDSPATQPNLTIAEKTLFADDQHWASTAQRILGNYYYCLVKATWPELIPPTLFPPLVCPWSAIP